MNFRALLTVLHLLSSLHCQQSWRTMFTKAYSPMLIVTAMIAMLQQ